MAEDVDFDAITEKDVFEECRDRLELADNAERENRNRAKIDLRFREGDQWDHDVITTASEEQPELTINLTDALVQRVENNIKQQRPRGKCHPVGDGATMESAEIMNGIGRHVEYRSEASVAYDGAAKSSLTCGWGEFRLLTEYVSEDSFEQDMRIAPIRNVFTVYRDPMSIMPTGQDAMWVILSTKEKRSEFKRTHPKAQLASWNDSGRDDYTKNWEDKEEIRLAEYYRIVMKLERLHLLRDSQGREFTRFASQMPSDESLAAAKITRVTDESGAPVVREAQRRQLQWFKLNGTKVVDRRKLPGQWIPVIKVEGNATDIDGKVWRRGMVRAMSDPQRMVNYGEVGKIKRLGLAGHAKWLIAEGQTDGHPEWTDENIKAYRVLGYKPVVIETSAGPQLVPPPQRLDPAGIEAGFSEFVQGMRTNLLAVAGMPHEPGADNQQGVVISGVAVKRRQYLSDQSHFHYYDNLTLAIAHCWRIMLEWIPHYYREPGRVQRILGEDLQPRLVTLNAKQEGVEKLLNDVCVGRYDVMMDTGPGYETKREEGAENFIELMKLPAFGEILMRVAPDLVARSIDHPYMQEIADRLSAQTPQGLQKLMAELPDRARSVIQALANQNQMLQQQLQAAQSGITKAHIAATVKAHDTETQAETKRRDTDTKAAVDIITEAMKHGHDERMAQHEAQRLEREAQSGSNGAGQ